MLLSGLTADLTEAGCDEAGRGCLAGPVIAAAVILPRGYCHPAMNDSKKLSHKQRLCLRKDIEEKALAWAIGEASNYEIDDINILNATFLAMHRAIDQLSIRPDLLIIDGNRFKPYPYIPYECIVRGDGRFYSIAAASILAKTWRDQIMNELSKKYPVYEWNLNKGYPTGRHRLMIRKYGITEYHRRSYRLLPDQLNLFD